MRARKIRDTVGEYDFFDLVTQGMLDGGAQVGKLSCFGLLEFQIFFRNEHELFAVKLFELAGGVFVNGIGEGNFEALLLEHLNEGRVLDNGKGFTSKVVNCLLVFGHASDIVCIGSEHLSK